MAVRSAVPGDLARLCELEKVCEGPDAWSENLVRDGLSGDIPTVTWLIHEEGHGYAVVSVAGDIAELQRLGVDPAMRRQGIASGLVRSAIGLSFGGGADRILLELREDNGGAMELYRGLGFTEIDRRPGYYKDGTTAIVMMRPLRKDPT